MVVRDLLTRGLLALGVAEALGEPQVSRAIAVEAQLYQQAHTPPDPVIVTRDVQSTLGLATGVLAIGTAFGGLFALAFAFAYGRIGRVGARVTAVAVAATGFTAIYLVPFLKYPANPPSVGRQSTIDHRTAVYFALMLISILATIGAIILGRKLTARLGAWNAALLTAGAFIAVIAVAYVIMPGVNEVPTAFPATTLWRFRVASLATQLTLWAAIGLIFGALTERNLTERNRTHRRRQKLEAIG